MIWRFSETREHICLFFLLQTINYNTLPWRRPVCHPCSTPWYCIPVWSNTRLRRAPVWGAWLLPCAGTPPPERTFPAAPRTAGMSRPRAGSNKAPTPAPPPSTGRPEGGKKRKTQGQAPNLCLAIRMCRSVFVKRSQLYSSCCVTFKLTVVKVMLHEVLRKDFVLASIFLFTSEPCTTCWHSDVHTKTHVL